MLRKLLYIVLLVSLPFLYSCKGPEGPAGPSGAQGPPGVAGAAGVKGEPGTGGGGAQQITLDTLSTDANGNAGRGFEVGEAAIKAVENGVILVYAKANNTWWPLPGVVAFDDKNISNYSFAYAIQEKNLIIQLFQLDEKPTKRKFQAVRIVVIPASNGRLNAEIDYTNYEAVRKAYNLPE